jgi:SAM-dependent methyltransferase
MVGIDAEAGQRVPCVQGGQLAIHRVAFWRELVIAYWLCQHSEYAFQAGYGDQDTWRMALALTGQGYHHLGRAPFRSPAFVCPVNDTPMIVHRPRGKGPPFDEHGFGSREARHLPGEARAVEHHRRFMASMGDAEAVFTRVYRYGLWGHGANSGGGSTAAEAAPYVELVNGLARVAGWRRVVDLACGDGAITRQLTTPGRSEVVGVDVYEPHLARLRAEAPEAQWLTLDIDRDRDQLPTGDVALLKDVLHHWQDALIADWLAWAVRSGKWRWLVLTYDSDNASPVDIPLGGYRALRHDLDPLAGVVSTLGSRLARLTTYLHKTVALVDCRTVSSLG